MPTKSYLCASVANGSTHYATVFDPVTRQVMVKSQWDPALLTTTQTTMESELQTNFGGDATVDYNVVQFLGVSTAGEAIWAIGMAAADDAGADFRNYMKVMAYSNTVARTVASLNQSVTKKSGQNYAQSIYLVGFGYETAYFGGYTTGSAPNVRIYEATSSGVSLVPCSASSAVSPGVPGMMYAAEPYLAFSALSSGNQAGYLLRKVSGTWGQVATVAGTSPTLYPLSRLEALATAGGISPTYIQSLGSTSETAPLPQSKDSSGSFQIDGATLTNLVTSGTSSLQADFNAAVGGTATVDKARQAFIYANYPTPAFWQNLVSATETI